jgi:hypothetical protein
MYRCLLPILLLAPGVLSGEVKPEMDVGGWVKPGTEAGCSPRSCARSGRTLSLELPLIITARIIY